MKKLFEKDEIWFAVLWIIIYVIGFANADSISESLGIPKILTVLYGLILSVILLSFIRKQKLWEYYGLCSFNGNYRLFLYFIPLILISSVNLWNGLTMNYDITTSIFYVISMCFVGLLEELIFRGFLFKGMCRTDIKSAILISSVTFGAGHIINLLLGAPILDTLLQIIYASAIGFTYTAIFYKGGSLIPCIVSHACINSMSAFAVSFSAQGQILVAIIQTILGISYGIWLLRR